MIILFIATTLLLAFLYFRENQKLQAAQIELARGEERLKSLQTAKEEVRETFSSLSTEALQQNNALFLELAKENFERLHERSKGELDKKEEAISQLIKPVQERLSRLDEGITNLEKERKGDHISLKKQLEMMLTMEQDLKHETMLLSRALSHPTIRGQWGEVHLRRIIELAGMVSHCDFSVQQTAKGIRPDVIIHLPGEKEVVIDAKTPFEEFIQAMNTSDSQQQKQHLRKHAQHLKNHIDALSKKGYWKEFTSVPECVILFLPSEALLSAALQEMPALIDWGMEQGVILATPTTLIALLKAIAFGWKQEKISKNAQQIRDIGAELYQRIGKIGEYVAKVGSSLGKGVEAYNEMIGSLEQRVLVSARKLEELGAGVEGAGAPPLIPLDQTPRPLTAPELSIHS